MAVLRLLSVIFLTITTQYFSHDILNLQSTLTTHESVREIGDWQSDPQFGKICVNVCKWRIVMFVCFICWTIYFSHMLYLLGTLFYHDIMLFSNYELLIVGIVNSRWPLVVIVNVLPIIQVMLICTITCIVCSIFRLVYRVYHT